MLVWYDYHVSVWQAHAAVDAGVVVAHGDGRAGHAHERGAPLRRWDCRRVRRRRATGGAVEWHRLLLTLVTIVWLIIYTYESDIYLPHGTVASWRSALFLNTEKSWSQPIAKVEYERQLKYTTMYLPT